MTRRPLTPRFGRRFETRSPEESRQLLAGLGGRVRPLAKVQPPKLSLVRVLDERTVSFAGDAVPPNFKNLHLPAVRQREQGPSSWSVEQDWREWAVVWGGKARLQAHWTKAGFGRQARVEIVFHRVRQLDRDGRFCAAVPILNGLKAVVKREPLGIVEGAALIYDDDPEHLPDELYEVRQVPLRSFSEQHTVVTVTRLE